MKQKNSFYYTEIIKNKKEINETEIMFEILATGLKTVAVR
jgi:hypothetical protein